MIVEFYDTTEQQAHDQFQQWRRDNDNSFFINYRAPNNMMLHRVPCSHTGDTEFGSDQWGSLTKNRKICSVDEQELRVWAKDHGTAELKICRDCMYKSPKS